MNSVASFDLEAINNTDVAVGVEELMQRLGLGHFGNEPNLDRDSTQDVYIAQLIDGATAGCQQILGYPPISRRCIARYKDFEDFQLPFPIKADTVPTVKYRKANSIMQKNIPGYFLDVSIQPAIIRLTGNKPADVETRMAAPYCVTYETGTPVNPEYEKAVFDAISIIVADQWYFKENGADKSIQQIHSGAVRVLSPWRKSNY